MKAQERWIPLRGGTGWRSPTSTQHRQWVVVRRLTHSGQCHSQKDGNRPNSHIPPTESHRLHEIWLQAARQRPLWHTQARLWYGPTDMYGTHTWQRRPPTAPSTHKHRWTDKQPLSSIHPCTHTHKHKRSPDGAHRWVGVCKCVNAGDEEHMLSKEPGGNVYYMIKAFRVHYWTIQCHHKSIWTRTAHFSNVLSGKRAPAFTDFFCALWKQIRCINVNLFIGKYTGILKI